MAFRRPKLARLLARLADPDDDVRFAALDELAALEVERLTERELRELLEAAGGEYPPHRYGFLDIPSDLVAAAARRPIDQHAAIAQDIYGRVSDRARSTALALLARLGNRSAMTTFVAVLREHGPPASPPRLASPLLSAQPAHGDVLFPALLDLAVDDELLAEALEIALAFARAEQLPAVGARTACARVEREWPRLRAAVRAAADDSGAWFWGEDYEPTRTLTGLALDVAGRVGGAKLAPILQEAMTLPDPRLAMFAICGALRHGLAPDAAAIERAAAQPEVRYWLFGELDELGGLELLPERHRTQAALAEAELAQWLTFPTELGREPDEIELMEVIALGPGDEAVDLYVFRFRTLGDHWSAAAGWQAGVAGPYPHAGPPTTRGLGATFSRFEPWDGATPEQHAQAMLATLEGLG